jgi:hypothetical protein
MMRTVMIEICWKTFVEPNPKKLIERHPLSGLLECVMRRVWLLLKN